MTIERGGQVLATAKKALFTFLREHYSVEVGDGQVLEARGDITNHEYEIHSDGEIVASISKRWFTLRDTYGRGCRTRSGRRAAAGCGGLHRRDVLTSTRGLSGWTVLSGRH
ncbi:MAG TPA: hypothetical protein VKI99_21200 [Candidatus Dormibacteraeota bacterium]|nr:hypothetical protein [Candidatus Dormibacteraeota bacterium]